MVKKKKKMGNKIIETSVQRKYFHEVQAERYCLNNSKREAKHRNCKENHGSKVGARRHHMVNSEK